MFLVLLIVTSYLLTIWIRTKDFFKFIKKIKESRQVKSANSVNAHLRNRSVKNQLLNGFLDLLYVNSRAKLLGSFFILMFSGAILLSKNNYTTSNSFERTVIIIMIVYIFIGIGLYIHKSFEDLLNDSLFYFLKLSIVIMYPLVTFQLLLNEIDNLTILFLAITLSIGYSFALIKNVIDSFKSLLFQFINFICILLILNLSFIGLTFGMFYINTNNFFSFYTEDQLNIINNGGLGYISFVIYKGLSPFFSFPGDIKISNDFIVYVPFIEHLFGYLFNLTIIGFFISYSVSKYFERRSNKKNCDAIQR